MEGHEFRLKLWLVKKQLSPISTRIELFGHFCAWTMLMFCQCSHRITDRSFFFFFFFFFCLSYLLDVHAGLLLSYVQLLATLWTVADQAPPSQARILGWVAISASRGSSRPRDRTSISCIGRRILYLCTTWEALHPRQSTAVFAHWLADASPYDFFVARSYWSLTLEDESHSVMSNSLGPHGLCCPWNSPGQNTE